MSLLEPGAAAQTKMVGASGGWRVPHSAKGHLFYCVLLEGSCRVEVDGEALGIAAGDFVLLPSADRFTVSSLETPHRDAPPVSLGNGAYRVGSQHGPPDMRALLGYGQFGSPDAALLVALLPRVLHVRGQERFSILVRLLADESRSQRAAREIVLARLLELLCIEALRCAAPTSASPGLARGLADERLAAPIRQMHADPARPWTVDELAHDAALSRSAFFERFNRVMGAPPMEYLLAWRMALAKRLLRLGRGALEDVAEHVGYGSARAFSVAFTRHVGMPPKRYARELATPKPESTLP